VQTDNMAKKMLIDATHAEETRVVVVDGNKVEEFDFDRELFEKLREKRTELASEMGVPAYIIFSDKTLKHLANDMPTNKEEMLEVNGVGMKKYEQFGEEFLAVINS